MANAQQQGPQWPFWLLVTPPTHNHNTAAHHRAVSLHQASGIVTPQQRETGQVPPRSGSAGTRPVLGRPSHRPPCSKFEQQQTAEEAAALVVLCARKHRRRARLLTLISQHTRTKANHHLELTKRFEGGVASACASGAPPVRLRCASGAPPVRLRCASGAPPVRLLRCLLLASLTSPPYASVAGFAPRDSRSRPLPWWWTHLSHNLPPCAYPTDDGGDAGVSSVLLRR